MRLIFPVHLLMSGATAGSAPFLIPQDDSLMTIWPIFSSKESAANFVQLAMQNGMMRNSHVIAEFTHVDQLSAFMTAFLPASVDTVWANGHLLDGTSVRFSERLPVREFFEELMAQSAEEKKSHLN